MRGKNYETDEREVDELVRRARNLKAAHAIVSNEELASKVAKILDHRNSNSPSTNGLLAIAIVRLI